MQRWVHARTPTSRAWQSSAMARQRSAPANDDDLRTVRRKPAASAAKGAQASGGAAPVAPPPPKTYTKTEPGSWLGPLKLKIDGSTLTLQPKRAPGEKVPSLILDMRRQGITVLPNASLLPDDTPSVYGILGVVKLNTSMLIGVITKASRVSCQEDSFFHIKETQLITHQSTRNDPTDLRIAALLQEAWDAKDGAGMHLYFSHKSHLTLSAQRHALQRQQQQQQQQALGKAAAKQTPPSPWAQADKRFVWNTAFMQPLIDAGAEAFAMPVMVGYVGQVPDITLPLVTTAADAEVALRVSLISRVERTRSGTVAWRSGLDLQGACGHVVETEFRVLVTAAKQQQQPAQQAAAAQATATAGADANGESAASEDAAPSTEQGAGDADARAAPDQAPPAANGKPAGGGGPPGGRTVFSLVQLRGSLPLLWSRPPNLELRPEARMCRDLELQGAALQSHLADLRQRYQSVSLLHVPSTGEADLVRALASLFPGTTHPHALPNGKAQPAPTAPDAGPTAHANGTHAAANDGDSATAEAGKAANGEARPGGAKLVLGGAAAAAAAAPLEEVLLLGGASGELCVVRGGGGGVGKEEEEGGGLTVEQVLRSGGLSGDVAAWLLDRPAQRRRLLEGARVRAGARHGSFVQVEGSAQPEQVQRGVLRLSCPGSTDLSNLLQAEVALEWAEGVLSRAGVLRAGASLRRELPALDDALRVLWAHQGGVLADQLLGSACLSSAYARNGGARQGTLGRIGAFFNRWHRYYAHNWSEYRRQDSIDMMLGTYKVDLGVKPPVPKPSSYSVIQLGGVCLAWALVQVILALLAEQRPEPRTLAWYVGLPSSSALIFLGYVWLTRNTYTTKPALAPGLTHPAGAP